MFKCLGSSYSSLGFGSSDLHCLIELVLDNLSCRRFDTIECNCWLFGGPLRLESLALSRDIVLLSARGEGLPHVLIPLVLLIDQVIGGRYMVMSVRFKASD